MLYIATHKKVSLPAMPGAEIIQVGAALHEPLPYTSDATGDNISAKNPNYCELTAAYWIWKNSQEEFKGLAHYRRFFGRSNLSSSLSSAYTEAELREMLKDHDIVLPFVEYFLQDIESEIQIQCCRKEVLDKLRKTVRSLTPDYAETYDKVFSSNHLTLFNMMYCRRELFDSYCEWLFTILFELEKSVDMTGYSPYEQRLYGFLSERLLNVWVEKNNLRVVHTAVTHTEMPMTEKLQILRRRFTNRQRFWLSQHFKK